MLCFHSSQDFFSEVHPSLFDTFSIGSVAPSAILKMANEEFRSRSHKSDECIRLVQGNLETAVETTIEAAGHILDSSVIKELMFAAQFGKSFLSDGCKRIADK